MFSRSIADYPSLPDGWQLYRVLADGGGTVTLTDNAETLFTPSAAGNSRYQLPVSEAWAAQMLEKIRNGNKQR